MYAFVSPAATVPQMALLPVTNITQANSFGNLPSNFIKVPTTAPQCSLLTCHAWANLGSSLSFKATILSESGGPSCSRSPKGQSDCPLCLMSSEIAAPAEEHQLCRAPFWATALDNPSLSIPVDGGQSLTSDLVAPFCPFSCLQAQVLQALLCLNPLCKMSSFVPSLKTLRTLWKES